MNLKNEVESTATAIGMNCQQTLILMGFILFILFNSANAYINNIINFPQLVQAVESGYNVRAVIFFNRCVVTNPDLQEKILTQLDGASAGFNFKTFFHSRENANDRFVDSVSTSRRILVESPSGKFLTLFSRLSVFEDNTAILHAVFFDAFLHTKIGTIDWLCNINTGRFINANQNPSIHTQLNPSVHSNVNSIPNLNLNTTVTPYKNQNTLSNVDSTLHLDANPNVNLNQNLIPFNANQLDNGLVLYY